MDERWQAVERIYHAARECGKSARPDFLDKACAGDPALRRQVESLLAQAERAGTILDSPAIVKAAESLAKDPSAKLYGEQQPEIGGTVSHYRVASKLGGGGMGVVYRAEDIALGRFVALKFLPDEFTHDTESLERFRHEAWAASSLNHPNICTIYEIAEHQGRLFIAMELVEGKTLAERLKQGPLPLEEATAIARQIGEALEEAHEHNMVHRDLKPANVMITPKGRVKILDFGLAKLLRPAEPDAPNEERALRTRAGAVMGTVPYMAPEQLRGEPVDTRADLYALGGVLYEMATGQRPFPETQTNRLIADILTRPPRPPRELNPLFTAELETVILKALCKEPSERYQSAKELLAALPAPGAASHHTPPPAREASSSRRRFRLPAMPVFAATVSALILASLAAFLVPSVRRRFITPPPPSQGLPRRMQLAVLPFSVIGGAPGEKAFSRGLAATLAAKLTQLSAGRPLQVVPVSDLAAQHVTSARQARRAFGVNLVLTGTLERAGGRVRISYSLVDPSTDLQLKARMLTLDTSDPFAIEDQVIAGSAGMLGLSVPGVERRTAESQGTQAAGAFQDYLKGLGYMQNYERAENIDKAIGSFQSALKVDPAYTLAYAALGQAFWRKYGITENTRWADRAQASCGHALTLDPKLSATHLCLGIMESGTGRYTDAIKEFQHVLDVEPTSVFAYEGLADAQYRLKRFHEAEATYRRALSIQPSYWAPYNWLGVLYFETGDITQAAEMFRKVTKLAPQNYQGFYNLGATDYMLGKWAEADEMLRKSIAIHPNATAYSNLGTVTFYEGRFQQSAGYFERAIHLEPKAAELWGNLGDAYRWSPGGGSRARAAYLKAITLAQDGLNVNPSSSSLLADMALFEAHLSNFKQAVQYLEKALSLSPKNVQFMYDAAIVYHLSGRRNKALGYLRKALGSGYPIQSVRADPEWRVLKNDPAFQQLVAGNKH